MISRDTHHARGSTQASYLSILAIIMASIAIGLWEPRGARRFASGRYRCRRERRCDTREMLVKVEVGERPPLRRPK